MEKLKELTYKSHQDIIDANLVRLVNNVDDFDKCLKEKSIVDSGISFFDSLNIETVNRIVNDEV